ncbi:MAG: hypothetical protein GQE15_12295 [Archangiaceae bacterium]|nr:hypothetical protein [Archangiaceae bacterium]
MRRNVRGSTLLETMIAGAVLLLGMVGVVQLLISGMSQFSRSNSRATGQDMAYAAVAEVLAMPFDAVPVGVADAGIIYDKDQLRFGLTRTVTDVGDGGARARQVLIEATWNERVGPAVVLRRATSTVIISEVPDAGP